MKIILIGYRGTGKSTIARHLSTKLGWEWLDADIELEFRTGKSIATIFAEQGEAYFRDLEQKILHDLLQRDQVILALGGGVVGREVNREALKNSTDRVIVWLTAAPEAIWKRIRNDRNRPALTNQGGIEEVRELLAKREPWYRELADLQLESNKTPGVIADQIIEYLAQRQ
jgi:shikimate kinase